MTTEIALVLTILVVSLILFVTERVRMDVVALMVLGAASSVRLSHPANVMVMGPGGYRFVDYLKLGVPLTLVVLVLVLLVLPIFWPFTL